MIIRQLLPLLYVMISDASIATIEYFDPDDLTLDVSQRPLDLLKKDHATILQIWPFYRGYVENLLAEARRTSQKIAIEWSAVLTFSHVYDWGDEQRKVTIKMTPLLRQSNFIEFLLFLAPESYEGF